MDDIDVVDRPSTGPHEAATAATSPPHAPRTSEPEGTPPRPAFVYAVGQIEPRFPSLGVEKEFAQAVGRVEAGGQTDRQALHAALSERSNRYLARQLCWVFTIEGLETYVLVPRDPLDLELFVESVRPRPSPGDLDVVIGVRGPIAEPDRCNGMLLPLVAVDQIYSFERNDLIAAIPRPDDLSDEDEDQFQATAEELLDRILQLADNAGATDEHRALNYLAVRYPEIYAQAARAHASNRSLSSVEVRPSRLSGSRIIVDVIFAYTNRQTDVTEKYFARISTDEEWPYLVTRLSPFYER